MDKLKKREKTILYVAAFFVALFVAYEGYQYLIASPLRNKVKTDDKNQEIITLNGSKNDVINHAEAGMDEYIIARAEANWKKNPFWDRSSNAYKEWASIQRAASGSDPAAKIIYSGYVDAGRMKIAILNGLEYRVGDQLEMEGYVLKYATPSKVLIVNKNTGNEVEIPIQE
jgi:hypothetical protein